MKLRQLQYLLEVSKNGLNITQAAKSLHTAQPGISRQIRLFEEELGVECFQRNGRHLVGITAAGREILVHVERLMGEVANIGQVAEENRSPDRGAFSVGAHHLPARYLMPGLIKTYQQRYPQITVSLCQGDESELTEKVKTGGVEFAILSRLPVDSDELVVLPCFRSMWRLLLPLGHPLVNNRPMTLEALAKVPLACYGERAQEGVGNPISRAFKRKGIKPNRVIQALDADVIKAYVKSGYAVGLLEHMALERTHDDSLAVINVDHLFEVEIVSIILRKRTALRSYTYDFIHQLADHLRQPIIDQALVADDPTRRHIFNTLLLDLGRR